MKARATISDGILLHDGGKHLKKDALYVDLLSEIIQFFSRHVVREYNRIFP